MPIPNACIILPIRMFENSRLHILNKVANVHRIILYCSIYLRPIYAVSLPATKDPIPKLKRGPRSNIEL